MFKWIGLILGFWVLGFFGALIGLFLGSIVDRISSLGMSAVNPFTNSQRRAIFLETAFTLMGKLAKADGRISESEIDHVEDFIRQMGMLSKSRQEAIRQFKRGAESSFDINVSLDNFMQHCANTFSLKQMLLVYLCVMALADGRMDNSERSLLEQIAQRLGYSRNEFNQVLQMVMGQAQFSGGQYQQRSGGASGMHTASGIDAAYQALGVTKDNTDKEIKRAYRKLMNQHHPDKLVGQGLPEDMITVATEKAKEIQFAYDLIKKHRNLK